MGQAWNAAKTARRPALRQRLSVRGHLPRARRRGGPGASLRRRRPDAAPPRGNLAQRRRGRPRRSHPRPGRMAHDKQARRAQKHHANLPAFPRPGAQLGRERLAVSAPELALKHRVRKSRRHRRRSLQRMAKAHRSTPKRSPPSACENGPTSVRCYDLRYKIFAELARKGGKRERIMIDAWQLKAHRTAASLLKKGLFPAVSGAPKAA